MVVMQDDNNANPVATEEGGTRASVIPYETRPSLTSRWRNWLNSSGPDFSVGTLKYTGRGMVIVFLWLFWGDMVFQLSESVFPNSIGLQLDRLGVPKEWIGYLKGTAAAVVGVIMVPVIGFRSDRTRSRWGRRIPYIWWTIIPVSVSLAALGFTDDIGAWIRASDWPARLHIEPMTMIIAVVGTMIVLFDVSNMFVSTVWFFLLRDVVPNKYLVRFMAMFGMVATMMNITWNAWFAERVETHTRSLYLGAAALYLIGFTIICLTVKEGEYPPPEKVDARDSLLKRFGKATTLYFTQCFEHPLILMVYVGQALFVFTLACQAYQQLYYLRYLNFTLQEQARYWMWQCVGVLIIKFPIGWTIDKFIHPMKSTLYSSLFLLPLPWLYFFVADYQFAWFFLPAYTMWVLINMYQCPLTQYYYLSIYPLQTKLFPAQQFGQFMSANSMVGSFVAIFAGALGATFMGWTNRKFGQYGNAFNFAWQGVFALIAFTVTWVTYRYWKLYGAENFKLDLEGGPRGVSKAELWRPVKIGAAVSAVIVALGVLGTVVISNRPSFGYEVNVDKELEYSRSVEVLRERAAKERAGFEARHAENLAVLAKKHWFYGRDTVTEAANYHAAISELEKMEREMTAKLSAAAGVTTAPGSSVP
jgi:maltose/moltooligosaccharide transporter